MMLSETEPGDKTQEHRRPDDTGQGLSLSLHCLSFSINDSKASHIVGGGAFSNIILP